MLTIRQNTDPFLKLSPNQIAELNLSSGTPLIVHIYFKDLEGEVTIVPHRLITSDDFRLHNVAADSDFSFKELAKLADDGNRIAFSLPSEKERYLWQKELWTWVDGVLKLKYKFPKFGK